MLKELWALMLAKNNNNNNNGSNKTCKLKGTYFISNPFSKRQLLNTPGDDFFHIRKALLDKHNIVYKPNTSTNRNRPTIANVK